MKQLEHFEPKETYINNILEDIVSKWKTPIERNILSDLTRGKISNLYWYLWIFIHWKKDPKVLEIWKTLYKLEKADFIIQLEALLDIYEEIRDNKEMIKEIFKHAKWKPSMFEQWDLEKIYNKIKTC